MKGFRRGLVAIGLSALLSGCASDAFDDPSAYTQQPAQVQPYQPHIIPRYTDPQPVVPLPERGLITGSTYQRSITPLATNILKGSLPGEITNEDYPFEAEEVVLGNGERFYVEPSKDVRTDELPVIFKRKSDSSRVRDSLTRKLEIEAEYRYIPTQYIHPSTNLPLIEVNLSQDGPLAVRVRETPYDTQSHPNSIIRFNQHDIGFRIPVKSIPGIGECFTPANDLEWGIPSGGSNPAAIYEPEALIIPVNGARIIDHPDGHISIRNPGQIYGLVKLSKDQNRHAESRPSPQATSAR